MAWELVYRRSTCIIGVGKRSLYCVFSGKTWTNKDKLVQVQRRVDFKNMLEVPRRNKARGLVIFWKEYFDLLSETFSPNHIDSTINKNKEDEWIFTAF